MQVNFAARRNTLESKRKRLVGVAPSRPGPLLSGWRCGGRLPYFEVDELRQVEVALARLHEGSYGFCQICGDDIPDARLDQLPATPFCQCCAV
ncbi:TraR/DksA family transcriptional regulator [Parasedimentitalea psychrophila]|uniref:TraR/DksA C4-type zinc finger protein n=1 Tax=Parasedimentitalea psychrophila TaxID=2997337 RepID=A0A9Y2KVY4_9RHOB|nr:TraR/DksA C4-type zinc finger protein [Parasedimentitalea psychrophila]WIY23529.1 TraR/DksA C4-type zinc finger protein [Parasedimentitalea psychrophila]